MIEFTCEKYLETFIKGWSDEEAEQECVKEPWIIEGAPKGLICDTCFEEFKIWFNELSAKDHKHMRLNK